jgi:hypothetical protein
VNIQPPELLLGEKVTPIPNMRLRRHHELNGDAVHLQLEDVIESDDESFKDTSSTLDISVLSQVPQSSHVEQAPQESHVAQVLHVPHTSQVPQAMHTLQDSPQVNNRDECTLPVPPRAAVVAIDIPNGPVAIATSPLETSHLETNSDHITWYSRPKSEVDDDGRKSPINGHNEIIQIEQCAVSPSLTSLPSAARTTPSPPNMVSDRQTPSPSAGSTQSW